MFDISHQNAASKKTDEGDKKFLVHIRKTKKSGVLGSANRKGHQKKVIDAARAEAFSKRQRESKD